MRTKQIKYSIAALVASVTVTTSCSRFEEMNINRNAVQNTTATTFVQPTVFNYEYRMINRSFTLTSQLMQYTVGHQQNADKISNYRIQNSVAAGYWNDFYSVGGNAQAMLEQARRTRTMRAGGLASIIKVIAMSTLTGRYGECPISSVAGIYFGRYGIHAPLRQPKGDLPRYVPAARGGQYAAGAVEGELRRFGGLHVQGRHQEMAQAG